ncbi:MAG: type II toxin-antitoxin system RelE/ParE family toxin [Synergistaceae bacterium]|jgi:toxin ParE1/3/4|nr:type II toxin-antitoxin system RelE/ParE family toxin [Synergistaceae bacterium]
MGKWLLTGKAKQDIVDIWRFTQEQWSVEQAESYLNSLYEKIDLVAEMPAMGIDCTERLNLGVTVYSIVHASHVIYYTLTRKQIVIVAVFHQRMTPRQHLSQRLGRELHKTE